MKDICLHENVKALVFKKTDSGVAIVKVEKEGGIAFSQGTGVDFGLLKEVVKNTTGVTVFGTSATYKVVTEFGDDWMRIYPNSVENQA
jgi:hypothetical protein